MATVKAKSSNPIRHNGATIVNGGKVSAKSFVTNTPNMTLTGHYSGMHGSVVADTNDVDKILANGIFAHKGTPGLYIMQGGVTSKIAGLTNSALHSPSAGTHNSIHLLESTRTRRVVTAGWKLDGTFINTPTNALDTYVNIDGGATIDHAARPTRKLPGEFVLMETGKKATYKDYEEKKNG